MLRIKKQWLAFAGLAVLLVTAGYLNFRYVKSNTSAQINAQPTQNVETQQQVSDLSAESVIVMYQSDREQTRSDEIAYLTSLVESENSDAANKDQAQQQMLELTQRMEAEMVMEGLIKAKGFTEVALTYHNDSIHVLVAKAQLTDAEVAQILDIVQRESGLLASNIRIIPVD